MNENTTKKVADVMHQGFCLLNGLVTVADALTAMREQQAHVVIIEKRDAADEYGLVLVSDIAKKVLADDRAPERVNLYEIMSKPLISVAPGMQVHYCARLFQRFGLTIAPVIDRDGAILGIVNYEDLVLRGMYRDGSVA